MRVSKKLVGNFPEICNFASDEWPPKLTFPNVEHIMYR